MIRQPPASRAVPLPLYCCLPLYYCFTSALIRYEDAGNPAHPALLRRLATAVTNNIRSLVA